MHIFQPDFLMLTLIVNLTIPHFITILIQQFQIESKFLLGNLGRMSFSPFKKNYIHEIRNIKPFKPRQTGKVKSEVKKVQKQKLQPQSSIQTFNDCIKSKISIKTNQAKYFEIILFDCGIFNINLVQVSNKLSQNQRKNISKLCIPTEQRLIKGLYLLPTQTIIECQYDLQNRFHRQMITYCPGQYLIVNNFTNGRLDKQQYNFNLKDLILVKTHYQNDRILKVSDYFLGEDQPSDNDEIESPLKIKLEKYFKDRKLCQNIYQLVEARFDWLGPVLTRSGAVDYYGVVDPDEGLPMGLGLLINHKVNRKRQKSYTKNSNNQHTLDSGWQFYFGTFESGLLNGLGQIWFQDKSSYFGQFDYGNAIGLGQLFSLFTSNTNNNSSSCFSYKDNLKTIQSNDFFRWLKGTYFNGTKPFPKPKNKTYILNQYQKLKKIYLIPKRKLNPPPQQPFENDQGKQSHDENHRQIDGFIEQINQGKTKINEEFQSSSQDITFNKNQQIRHIFEKIKVRDQKTQKPQVTSNKNLNMNRIDSLQIQENQRKFTSRSDDHAFHSSYSIKSEQKDQINKVKRNYTLLHENQNHFNEKEDLPHFHQQNMNQNQEIDLGYQQVDESYFRNRQGNSSYKDLVEKDYIHKEYAFEEPKRLRTPDYFIVQSGKNDPKYDPTGAKSNLVVEDSLKKNQFSGPSPMKKQKYLSPERKKSSLTDEKQNKDNQKLQKTLTAGKIKRIFYNPTKKNQF